MEKEDKKYELLLDKALSLIDAGFEKMGREIKDPTILDRFLLASTYKVIRFCEALKILCNKGFSEEAFPVLRSIIELTVNTRWILNKDSMERLRSYLDDLGSKGFGKSWTNKSLSERMKELGFAEEYYFFCVKVTYSYSHVNASSLAWGEVYDIPELKSERWKSESLYVVAAQMMGHFLFALDTKYPRFFPGYKEIWDQISVDKDIKKKFDEVIKKINDQK